MSIYSELSIDSIFQVFWHTLIVESNFIWLTGIVLFFLCTILFLYCTIVKPILLSNKKLSHFITTLNSEIAKQNIEFKYINEELHDSRNKYKQLFHYAPTGIYEIDFTRQRFCAVNKLLCDYTGYQEEEFLQMDPLTLLADTSLDVVKKRFHNINNKKMIPSTVEIEVIKKDKSKFSAILNNSFKYLNGKIIGATVVVHDITEKKKNDAKKTELLEKLNRAKKMEALGLLAGGVAHDLNNILSGLINYPDIILADLPPDSKFIEPMKAIKRSGKLAAAVADDLITVARGAVRTKENVNLSDIVDEFHHSIDYINLKRQYPTISFHFKINHDIPVVEGVSIQLHKTLFNLVINAVEASGENGIVEIKLTTETITEPIICFDRIEPEKYVKLSVTDTGPGISKDDMERIFEPFYTKKVMGRSGTGIGLAVVWNTVEDHNGHINIKREDNRTVFDLYFNIKERESIPQIEFCQSIDLQGEGEEILIIDDEKIQRDIVSQLLQSLGYKTTTAEDGEEALSYLSTNTVDLVILDMVMDENISGLETFNRIKELNYAQNIMIMTGFTNINDVKYVLENGAKKLLKKPFSLDELGSNVKQILYPEVSPEKITA